MNTPPFLLAAAALFWGSQTGDWALAIGSAALLEAPRYFAPRWHLKSTEFSRVADFCTVLLFALAVYLYFTFGNPRAITLLFQWMPLVLLPLALAQAWSTSREIDLSVLFWSLRRNPIRRAIKFNLAYPAFALWLLAASAANHEGAAFYPGLALLVAWPLLLARPRSYATPLATTMLLAAALAGYGGQLGLHHLQLWLEVAAPQWLAGDGVRTDPYRSRTDIGAMGELKLSPRIVLRVEADPALRTPILLHRASYDDYVGGTWIARNGKFEQLAPYGDTSIDSAPTWRLGDAQGPLSQVMVHDDSDGNPVLSLPAHAVRIEGLAAIEMKMNALGTVQIQNKPGFFSYRAQAGGGDPAYGPPAPRDLGIPKAESAAVARIAGELALAARPPEQALATVKQFFADHFEYSTWQGQAAGGRAPIAEFLLATRAGHCEYFASATALLLRAAGIPARYATGFSVQEWSKFDGAYLVRQRHAHAWVRAWVGSAWRDIDTTPPGWFSAEAANPPLWSPLADLWSWARFRIAGWSSGASGRLWSWALIWLVLPLVLWLAWRTLHGRRAQAEATAGDPGSRRRWPGQDSEFYLVQSRMAQLGHARSEARTIDEWLAQAAANAGMDVAALHALARLHLRHRFDPVGLSATERQALRAQALAWLAQPPAPARASPRSRADA